MVLLDVAMFDSTITGRLHHRKHGNHTVPDFIERVRFNFTEIRANRPFFQILEMHLGNSILQLCKLDDRINSAHFHPKDIHFEEHVGGKALHEYIEPRLALVHWLELESMVVVGQANSYSLGLVGSLVQGIGRLFVSGKAFPILTTKIRDYLVGESVFTSEIENLLEWLDSLFFGVKK